MLSLRVSDTQLIGTDSNATQLLPTRFWHIRDNSPAIGNLFGWTIFAAGEAGRYVSIDAFGTSLR
jgi:hypothetical protein